jgi:hypothetical protein
LRRASVRTIFNCSRIYVLSPHSTLGSILSCSLADNHRRRSPRCSTARVSMTDAYDWRSPDATKQLMKLDRDQFAIEFLRRNPAYANDYHNTLERTPPNPSATEIAMEGLARRWGLTFSARPGHPRVGLSWFVAARAFAIHCHGHRRTNRFRRRILNQLRWPFAHADERRNARWPARPAQRSHRTPSALVRWWIS